VRACANHTIQRLGAMRMAEEGRAKAAKEAKGAKRNDEGCQIGLINRGWEGGEEREE
jgi:hypothetical protein